MKKDKDDTKKAPRGGATGPGLPREMARLADAIEWGLDIAAKLAPDDDEHEAIERTRGYFHAWLAGRPAEIDLDDVLTTLAVLFATIELDLVTHRCAALESLRNVPAMLHLPGASRHERGSVVIRRFPPHRHAMSSLASPLATA